MADIDRIKVEICEIGRRIYDRGFAAANDGNISARIGPNQFLCTPTMHCKGFLEPDDIATIDSAGNQIGGEKKRSSEALLHLQIYQRRPDVNSVVHCHPPHATAFAIARHPIPQSVLPEVEIFLGEVPITRYETPGTAAFAETILPVVEHANVIVLANHGTVSYGPTVERAYWPTEILDAYCRMLILAKQLGGMMQLSDSQCAELVELKKQWGMSDPRHAPDFQGEIGGNATFRSMWPDVGVRPGVLDANAQDQWVTKIAAEVVRQLGESSRSNDNKPD